MPLTLFSSRVHRKSDEATRGRRNGNFALREEEEEEDLPPAFKLRGFNATRYLSFEHPDRE